MTLKLEVGKTYVDTQNRKVKIIHKSAVAQYPYWGAVNIGDTPEYMVQYTQDGCGGGIFNLLKEYVEPVYRWLPLYRQGYGQLSLSLDQARKYKTEYVNVHGTVCFIGLYRVDLNTGDITKVEEGDDITVIEDEEEAG